jgi:hypothetical protein
LAIETILVTTFAWWPQSFWSPQLHGFGHHQTMGTIFCCHQTVTTKFNWHPMTTNKFGCHKTTNYDFSHHQWIGPIFSHHLRNVRWWLNYFSTI